MLDASGALRGRCMEYCSSEPQHVRSASLAAFRSGAAEVMVSSDAMTRGMDVEGVDAVVNYDAPVYVKTYVHRVGRTARAGAAGEALTLISAAEARHFKQMVAKAQSAPPQRLQIAKAELEAVLPAAEKALAVVKARAGENASVHVSLPSGSLVPFAQVHL